MNPLIAITEKIKTEPFEIGTFEGELYPSKIGYDKKKTFIYGKGYVTLKNKHIIQPLVIGSNMAQDIIDYYNKFGSAVLIYALGRESLGDCCNSRALSQLKSLVNFQDGWLEYFDATHAINEKIKEVIKEKWGVVISGEWMQTDNSKGKDNHSFRKVLQFMPTTSLYGMIAMEPHIDWLEYESVVDSFITHFTPMGNYNNTDELLVVMDKLDNESVSNKLEYITNKEIIKMINALNAEQRSETIDKAQTEIEF